MERKRLQELENEKQSMYSSSSPQDFAIGDRVFHSKFGVGKITNIQDVAGAKMYIVNFSSQGEKALDAAFAQLKKF